MLGFNMRLTSHTHSIVPKVSDDGNLGTGDFRRNRPISEESNLQQPENLENVLTPNVDAFDIDHSIRPRTGTGVWHRWTVIIPRRSIMGGFVWGTVWRRTNRRRWLYKRFD